MNATPTQITHPEPVFLGYGHKQCRPRPAWLADPRVVDLANVTDCNLPRPNDWVQRWDFNAAGYYDSPEKAQAALTALRDPGHFELFAYDFYPLRFDAYGGAVVVDPVSVFGESFDLLPRPKAGAEFEFLGYDAVERWAELEPGKVDEQPALGGGFGCSPLFCNNLSCKHPVNTHCLIDQWNDAVAAALCFGKEQPEPGCYYIFGVYRATRPSALDPDR